jgi:hypothetical protein
MAGPTQPFRFLDLPMELRLMVYEHLPASTKVKVLDIRSSKGHETYIILRYTMFQVALLATCKLIRAEAESFINEAMEEASPEFTHSASFFVSRLKIATAPLFNVLCTIKLLGTYLDRGSFDTHLAKDKC